MCESSVWVVRDALIISAVRFLRDCLADILGRVPQLGICKQAATLEHAFGLLESTHPGIVLHDVAFPGGADTAARLCAAFPDISVIALGVCETEESVLAWAEAGIAGYVPNTASVDDLVELIGKINRGEQPCSSRIAGSLLRRIAARKRESTPASCTLTQREQQIFRLVGAGLCNKDIARRLGISLGTTKTHVHNLLGKLSVQRRADVIVSVRSAHHDAAPR
jgi:DNA-binding NarL/FixJ family response regulator